MAVQPSAAKDPYQVLEVRPGALEELVTEAYWHHVYRLQRELRNDPTVVRLVEELNQAYEAVISEYALAAETNAGDRPRFPMPSMEAAEETIWQNPREYYTILHVDRDATPEVITLAYEVMRARFSRRKPIQAAILRKIEEAYMVLGSPALRDRYDSGDLVMPEEEPLEEVVTEDVVDRIYLNVFAPLGERLGRLFGRRGEPAEAPGGGGQGLAGRLAGVASAPLRFAAGLRERSLPSFGRRRRRRLRLPARAAANGSGAIEREAPETVTALAGAWLRVQDVPGGRVVPLPRRPLTIGADPSCEVVLGGDAIAPQHARIWYRDGRYLFHRLDRPREVKVSGRPLDWAVLESGDVIQIGPHELAFEEPAGAAAAAAD